MGTEIKEVEAACAKALRLDGLPCDRRKVSKEEGGARMGRKAAKSQILKGLVGHVKACVFILKVM